MTPIGATRTGHRESSVEVGLITDTTIAAISSVAGPAARMIVRITGPRSFAIVSTTMLADEPVGPVGVVRRSITVAGSVCPGWLYVMAAPRSATGEDTVEIHIPGNPILAKMVLDTLLDGGARSAEPGEFTARAFFNGRLDLAAAEGVAGIIAAQNQQELIAARQLMAGELSRRLQPILDQLATTLALVETGLDFSEEDITVIDRSALLKRIRSIEESISELIQTTGRFASLPREPTIVLFGRPNAGKSSLLNALASSHRAVVSSVAGTTRDALSATIRLRRGFAKVVDVAGIDSSSDSDEIADAMQQTAWRAAAEADVLVLIRDATDDQPSANAPRPVDLVVYTKTDLQPMSDVVCGVSTVTGEGLDQLRDRLDDLAFRVPQELKLSLNSRHEQAIQAAVDALARIASAGIESAGGPSAEIDAMELREALDAIGSIIGVVTPDEILGKIFSTFCIGK